MIAPDLSIFPQVRVVEASAGSGKTYCLASRYLSLLINPALKPEEVPLERILAVTFTNKSAWQMKARILDFLKRIALDKFKNQEEKDAMLSILSMDEESARRKSFLVMEQVIRNYNFFQVQTIDSFINTILSGCAFKLGLSANFKIKPDYKEHLAYSLDLFIDQSLGNPLIRKHFNDFLENYLYLENKKSWLPKKDILSVMSSLFDAVNIAAMDFVRFEKEAGQIRETLAKIRLLMLELKKNMPEGSNLTTWRSFIEKFSEETQLNSLEDFFKPFSKEVFGMRSGFSAAREALELWEEIKEMIRGYYESKSFSLFNCYIDIFQGVSQNLRDISKKEDILFLSQLNLEAEKLFEEGYVTVPELYYRLAVKLQHFLIDEFQDTSRLQWKNIFPMVEDALSRGGSLFYVGDRKQAIYRFRGGDVSLVDAVKEELSAFNVIPQALTKNYRSQKAIVEFNNRVFSRDNLLRFISERKELQKPCLEFSNDDILEITDIFHASTQEYLPQNTFGYVEIEDIESDNEDDTDSLVKDRLLGAISGLSLRFSYDDIAILCRSNREVESVSSWLVENKIPVASEKTLNISENFLIKELVSFLKFLDSPIDNISFAAFILGDIFSAKSTITKEEAASFIFRALRLEKPAFLYREFQNAFPKEWQALLDGFFKTSGFVPLYELTISILEKFSVMENFPSYQGFFMKLLELIKEQEEENQDIQSFLEYFVNAPAEDLYIYFAETNAVKALTIHKAKGLEFPAVIIPFLEMKIKVGSGKDRNNSFVVRQERGHLELNYLKRQGYTDFSPELEARFRDEYKKAFIDELNSIYVALTRAKYELYAFIPKKSASAANIARLLVPAECRKLGERLNYEERRKKKEDLIKVPVSEYKDWVSFLKEEFEGEPLPLARDSVLRGEALHYILSLIGNLSVAESDRVLEEAVEKAARVFSAITEWDSYIALIEKILSDKKTTGFFFCDDALIYREKEISDSFGNLKRIDRLIVKKDEVIIIDYKSSTQGRKEHEEQLKDYIKLAKDLFPGRRIKGLLFYFDDLSLKEVNV